MKRQPRDVVASAPSESALHRPYRGSSAHDRISERRDRLVQAAIEVYSEAGFANASIQKVCDAAGLTKRYFYESFSDSSAVLAAAFRKAFGEFYDELREVADAASLPPDDRARAILTAWFEGLREDPRQTRLFLLDARGVSAEVDEIYLEARAALIDLIAPPARARGRRFAIQRGGAAAGLAEISICWIDQGFPRSISDLVDATMGLLSGLIPPERPGAG